EDGIEFSLSGSYFQTMSHTNSKSEIVPLQENESFQQVESNLMGKYGLTSNLELAVGLRFRGNMATFENSAGETTSITSTGLDAYLVSARYSFPRQAGMQYALEGNYSQTTYERSYIAAEEFNDGLVLGDG